MLKRVFFAGAIATLIGASRADQQENQAHLHRLALIAAHTDRIFDLVVSEDGKRLITTGGESDGYSLRVWDLETKKCLRAVRFLTGSGRFPTMSGFGRSKDCVTGLVAKGPKGRAVWESWDVIEFDIKAGAERVLFSTKHEDSPAVAFWVGEGMLVTYARIIVGDDVAYALKFINYVTKQGKWLVQDRPFKVRGFTPDKKLVALEFAAGNLKVFDWVKDKKVSELAVTFGQFDEGAAKQFSTTVEQCYFFSDNKTMVAFVDGLHPFFEKWDIGGGKLVESGKLRGNLSSRWPIAVSADERLVAMGGGLTVSFFDLKNQMKHSASQVVHTLEPGQMMKGGERIVRFLPDGKTYLLGYNGGQVLHMATPKVEP